MKPTLTILTALLLAPLAAFAAPSPVGAVAGADIAASVASGPLDLSPAKWLWYPGDRTLPNTFVLFRRVLRLDAKPRKATGWIIGESRYQLEVNGKRVQWGPAPNDPRWPEVDPMDLTEVLTSGENVLGATVLYFGQGDATCPMSRAGFIFKLEVEHADGRRETVVSDNTWRCHLSQAWKPGQHRMFFMRALQEEFDGRLHPHGWNEQGFAENQDWLEPYLPPCPANQPIFADPTNEVMNWIHGPKKFLYGAEVRSKFELRPRPIPLMRETWVSAAPLVEQHRIKWNRPIAEYFAVRPSNSYQAEVTRAAQPAGEKAWRLELDPDRGTTLTFTLPEQSVGWPGITIEAPAGSRLEMMQQDGHQVGGPALMNTHYHKWARFTCREGVNHFRWFDFDCFRWMQIHLHPGRGTVVVSNPGILKREYPWPNEPRVITSEAPLQRVFDAATNTMRNAAQETFVDGMSRERNQYSGDVSQCRHAIHMLAGENRQVARFLRSFSQGITPEGYFMDAWPSHDRITRMGQRVLEATHCGALLDVGVVFASDCWEYYLYTGDLAPLRESYPRLLRLVNYLRGKMNSDDLLPADQEAYGFPIVYMGFSSSFPNQRDRQCPFNLEVAHMLSRAMAPMCLAGIHLLEPAFKRYEIRPQLADLPDLALTVHTPHGPIGFSGKGPLGARTLTLTLPPNAAGELVVHPDESLNLKSLGQGRFALPAGQTVNLELRHTSRHLDAGHGGSQLQSRQPPH